MLIDLKQVANEIKTIGLYDLILQDCQKILNKPILEEEEIFSLLQTEPKILENYKQTNVENNISNIHFENIVLDKLSLDTLSKAKQINQNLDILRDIEKYTLSFEESPTLVFIFSIEFFVLFSVQYFIVLLGLKEWQIEIYGAFLTSVLFAWIYAKKQQKKYELYSKEFDLLYDETKKLIVKYHQLIN